MGFGATKYIRRFAQLLDIAVTRAEAMWARLNADGTVSYRTALQSRGDLIVGYAPAVDVMAYGCAGDDITNDTANFQAAMDAVPSRGTLLLPASKTFKITSALTRTNAQGPINIVSLGGEYGGSIIHQSTANTRGIYITVTESATLSEQDKASMIRGVRFNGPAGNTSGAAIYSVASIDLDYVSTYGFWNGLELGNGAYYSHATKSMFTQAANAGVYSVTNPNHNLQFTACRFDSCAYGALINGNGGAQRLSFNACAVERNTAAGIKLDDVYVCDISDCYFESATTGAPDILIGGTTACYNTAIKSCWFTKYPGVVLWHIDLDRAHGTTISDCYMNGSDPTGGDIRASANTTGTILYNTTYLTISGLGAGYDHNISSNGDGSGNSVGYRITNSYGAVLKSWALSVDQTYDKGLNFSEPGVADGRLFLKRGGGVGIGNTSPTEALDVTGNVKASGTLNGNTIGAGSTSGTNTGDQTTITGNAATATKWATARTVAITGDLTYNSGSLDGSANVTAAGTLATVNSNVGSFGSATQSVAMTVNAKGLVTAASASTITPAVGSITGLGTGVAAALGINPGDSGGVALIGSDVTFSNVTATGNVRAGGSGYFVFLSSTSIRAPSNGALCVANTGGTDFGLLMLGGTTSSFPAIKRSGSGITIRLADDSANTALSALSFTGDGSLLTALNSANITASTTNALGIGTIELGHASDTTLARLSAGQLNIEGVQALTASNTVTVTNKSIDAGQLTGSIADARNTVSNSTTTTLSALATIGGLTTVTGTGAMSFTGGAGNMTITSGTGNSRTMIFRTTTSSGTATTALTLNADQSATFAGAITSSDLITSGALYQGSTTSNYNFAVGSSAFLARSNWQIRWYNSTGNIAAASIQTSIASPSAGLVNIGTDGSNALGSLAFLNGTATGTLAVTGVTTLTATTIHGASTRLKVYTVATLPASPTQGDCAAVSDALTPAFLTVIVGGGSTYTPCTYNGTAWVGF